MKSVLKITIAICLFIATNQKVNAQNEQQANTNNGAHAFMLPPVFSLVDSAIRHNALVRLRSFEMEAKESNINSQRKYWLKNLGMQADTRYGTFDNFSSNANGQSTNILNTTSKQLNYGAGVYLKIPLSDLLDRKNQIRKAKVELEQAKSMYEAQMDELKQLVIRQYQDLILKQRILLIKSEGIGNAKVNMEMAEKEFKNGSINVSEYSRISEIANRASTDYETAKAEFITTKMILEDIIGFSLTNGHTN